MKKWLHWVLLLAVIPILSFGGLGGEDVGKLRPVQVVEIRKRNNGVQLQTDTQDLGVGADVIQAVKYMKDISPARVFLDTADYLLIEPGAEIWLSQLQEYLRPSCCLCYITGEVDLYEAGQYLQLHAPKLTLTHYEAGKRNLPELISKEGSMKLVQP